uniref:Uncharacterized protein n=1 Tax=Alexandrium monilatum TaxID=311494 RepID=A0A7S4UZA3_9DINO
MAASASMGMECDPLQSESAESLLGVSYGSVSSPKLASSEAGGRSSREVADLPDLTERLKEAGIYGEYSAYRNRYMRWRKGGARGAVGELTASALAESGDPNRFEYWYPTASVFKWHFTSAYWIAIFYLLGAFLFTFANGMAFFNGPGGYLMLHWLNFIGSIFFGLAAYMAYLQLINMGAEEEGHRRYLFPNCEELSEHVVASSVIGTVSYFLGAVLFSVGAVCMFGTFESLTARVCLIALPNFLGSTGFFIGGISEVIHNRLFRGGATPADLVWWTTLANAAGDTMFFMGSLPDLFLAGTDSPFKDSWVSLNYSLGSFMFILSAILMLAMWRVNDFGLTLLKQLNLAIRATGYIGLARSVGAKATQEYIGLRIDLPEDKEYGDDDRRLSARGAMFIVIYTWFAFVGIVNTTSKHIWYESLEGTHLLQHFLDLGMQLFTLCVIGLVLVVHSVITELPDEEPYYFALMASRFALVYGAIVQTCIMVTFICGPWDPASVARALLP